MALMSGTLEFEVELKSPGSTVLETYTSKKANLTKICSDTVKRIDLLAGEWGKVGCVLVVYSSVDGIEIIQKEIVEAADEKNKSITYNILEGEPLKLYKYLKTTFQIVSKNEREFLKMGLQYEKLSDDVLYTPDQFKEVSIALAKTIDAYYCQSSNS